MRPRRSCNPPRPCFATRSSILNGHRYSRQSMAASSDRKVDAGNLVSGGQVGASLLTTIVSLHPIHFVFNVSEPDYVRYSRLAANGQWPSSSVPGNVVQIRLADEKEWIRNGRMNFIDNQLNGKSGTIRARALVDNEDFFLTPGTFGRLRLFGGNV